MTSITVTAKDDASKPSTCGKVTQILSNKVIVPIKGTYINKSDSVIVKCENKEGIGKVEKAISEELSENYDAKKQTLNNPKVRIVDIEDIQKEFTDNNKLMHDIRSRNFPSEEKSGVMHSYTNKRGNLNALMEVTPEQHWAMRNRNYKIFVGNTSCKVFDESNVMPCRKCGRFGHNTNKCANDLVCLICAGDHNTTDCICNTERCANCSHANKFLSKKRNTDHTVVDAEKCETL